MTGVVMSEILSLPFMQRALIAGILVSLLAGYYGVFVVQRKLSFLGNGLAHATFGGVALAMLVGMEPLTVALPFTVFASIGITSVRRNTALGSDTVIGIFFAISMALGIVFLALREDYATDAFAYLFGSILAVSNADVWVTLVMVVLSLLTLPIWGRWSYSTFDTELAEVDRVKVARDDYLLSVLIAVTVVVAVKVMGIVLVTAYLVVPAASARLISRTFSMMTITSVAFGIGSTILGLIASYHLDLPSGAMIVLVQSGIFIVCLPFSRG